MAASYFYQEGIMRRYMFCAMEVDVSVPTSEITDAVTIAMRNANLGRFHPDPEGDERGITVVLKIGDDEQRQFNAVARKLDLGELVRPT